MKEGWKYKKLGDCCEVLNGFAFKSDKYVGAGTRVIRITNVQKGYIVDDDPKYYPDDEMSHLGQYCLYENDLLMSLTGNVGRVGLLQKEMLPAALNQRVACLRIKGKDISLRYLFHCLNSVVFEQKAIYSATGIAQKNMSTEWLKKYEIPVPSLPEQECIVAELDCLSDIIEKQKQQLKELDNLAQSIFYTTFGDPISNNFGWNVKKLGDVCTIERGGSPRPITDYITDAEDGVNWIKIGDASEGSMYINSVKEKIKPEGVKKSRKVYKGDFILSNSMSFGKPYILGVDGCIHDGWLVIRDNNNVFNKCYLYYYLSSDALYGEFKSLAVGGVVNNLNSNLVRGVKVCIPDMSLQHEFASKIEAIERQKDMIKQSIEETETLFNSRMDYYFN